MKPYCLTVCLFLATSLAGCERQHSSSEFSPPPGSFAPITPKLESFDLTDQDGKPFSSKTLNGTPWVGSFFFTQCPAVCWRMNQAIAKWQEEHPESKIKFVSITCDPTRDTPEALTLYAKHFKADPKRWTFLTGDMNYITKVGQDKFLLAVQPETHSSRAVVFDGNGQIHGTFEIVNADDFARFEKLLAKLEAESDSKSDPEAKSEEATK